MAINIHTTPKGEGNPFVDERSSLVTAPALTQLSCISLQLATRKAPPACASGAIEAPDFRASGGRLFPARGKLGPVNRFLGFLLALEQGLSGGGGILRQVHPYLRERPHEGHIGEHVGFRMQDAPRDQKAVFIGGNGLRHAKFFGGRFQASFYRCLADGRANCGGFSGGRVGQRILFVWFHFQVCGLPLAPQFPAARTIMAKLKSGSGSGAITSAASGKIADLPSIFLKKFRRSFER